MKRKYDKYGKISIMKVKSKVIKIKRSEEEVVDNIRGEMREFTKVKTRLDKDEFAIRRDMWNEEHHDSFTNDKRFGKQKIDYAQYVEWGNLGGAKRKWNSDAERKMISRLRVKVRQAKILKPKDYQLLSKYRLNIGQLTAGKNGRPREYYVDRPASNTERTRKRRLKLKEEDS
jgi:hypothetical protein